MIKVRKYRFRDLRDQNGKIAMNLRSLTRKTPAGFALRTYPDRISLRTLPRRDPTRRSADSLRSREGKNLANNFQKKSEKNLQGFGRKIPKVPKKIQKNFLNKFSKNFPEKFQEDQEPLTPRPAPSPRSPQPTGTRASPGRYPSAISRAAPAVPDRDPRRSSR